MTPTSILAKILNLPKGECKIEKQDKYLYEIIEEYKEAASDEEKDTIFKAFCNTLWSCDNKRRTVTRAIRFKVRKDLLKTESGKVFDMWSEIEYKSYIPTSSKSDWCSIIRQKINNIYTRYFDKEVILSKEYMQLLNVPKKLYYRWINGEELDEKIAEDLIRNAISSSIDVKKKYQMQKMILSWNEYKKLTEEFLNGIISRCKLIDEYEDENKFKGVKTYDCNNEDCIYTSYFCKSIEGEMLKWQKKYYGVREHKKYKRCRICGALIENTGNKKMYCTECARENERKNAAKRKQRWLERNKKS